MSTALLRPIGFRPWEISQLVNRPVIQYHAGEAAFLWMQRNHAVQAPHFRLKHLAKLDRRLEGHLEGLRLGAATAWNAAQSQLENCDMGTVFVISYLAFHSRDAKKMRSAVLLGLSAPEFQTALLAALNWIDFKDLLEVIDQLKASPEPRHQLIALSVATAHRIDPGSFLQQTLGSDSQELRARALRSIGELKRTDLLPAVQYAERDADATCRFWAGYAMALLGDPQGAQIALDAALAEPSLMYRGIEVAMRCGNANWARDILRRLASENASPRFAIKAAGALGDPSLVPWLFSHMQNTAQARVAGEAFSMISGADLDYLSLKQDAPEDAPEEELEEDDAQDADLPWPDVDNVSKWWGSESNKFSAGQRYLAGHQASAASAMIVLREGYQRQRRSAAIEFAYSNAQAIVFPVAGRADWQRQRLSA